MGMIGMDLRARQQLALTPRLQQSVKLLQLSAMEFEQALQQAIGSNPFLEEDDPHSDPAPGADAEESDRSATPLDASTEGMDDNVEMIPSAGEGLEERFDFDVQSERTGNGQDSEDSDWTEWAETTTSLRDHLQQQLLSVRLNSRDLEMAGLIIEALDEDGYLRQTLEELAEVSTLTPQTEPEEFLTPLKLIQNMDPVGVGARDLSECLAIQLREQPPSPEREIALTIVLHHLGALARREFARLQQAVGCNEPALRSAHAKIRRLNPRPGAAFSKADARYVVPDVIVRRHRQQWVATINPAVLPTIRVNRRYAEIFRRARDASHAQLGQQLQEARWLVRNTEQRFATILRVAETIVARQKNFFDYGDVAMKPLGLRHIAIELDLHESTISRATGNKYMSTPRGMFEFRHFFSRELDTDTGGTCSATAIRALLREMITAEDHAAPLSDVRLADQLASQGIQVARRTVTKYRRLMQVPPVELRRLN